jgi:hypothetical protein
MITQLPWSDKMGNGEEPAEYDADSCYDDISNAEEGVLAANYGAGGDDDRFCAAVLGYIEVRAVLVKLLGNAGKERGRTYGGQCSRCRFQLS